MIHLQASNDFKMICLEKSALEELIEKIKEVRTLPAGHNRRFNGIRRLFPFELKIVLTYPYYTNNFYPIALNGKILKIVAKNSSYNGCLDIIKLINFMKEVANSKNKSSLSKQHKQELEEIIPKWIDSFDEKDLNILMEWLKGKGKLGVKKEDLLFIYSTSIDFYNKTTDKRKDVIIK